MQKDAEAVDDGAQRVFGIDFALGAAQVRGQNDFGFVLNGVLDGRQGRYDAGVVGDGGAVFSERDVEIDTNENPFVGQIDIANGQLGHENHSGRELEVLRPV